VREAAVIEALNVRVEAHPVGGFGGIWIECGSFNIPGTGSGPTACTVQWACISHGEPADDYRGESRHRYLCPPANEVCSADFLSDALYHGMRLRTFNVIDDFNREALAIEIDTSLRAVRLIHVFERLQAARGLPTMLRVDNGPELLG
jgi:transposase InsO family protein